jgi:hypothetical protein
MSIAFLLLGKTNVAFFDATAAQRVSTDTPPAGVLGVVENVGAALGFGEAPEALLTLDVSINEGHSLRSSVVSHEVETGVEVTDHVRTLPRELTIQGLITDTPSGIEALAIIPGLVDRFGPLPPSVEAFQKFEEFWRDKQLLDVVTGLKVYQNMIIESVEFPKSAQVGRSLQFSIRMKEVRFVTSATVGESSLDGFGTTDVGTQSATGV